MRARGLLHHVVLVVLLRTCASRLAAKKAVYTVGTLTTSGNEDMLEEWGPTFVDYLGNLVGPQFDPPIHFQLLPLTLEDHFNAAEQRQMDFVFSVPTALSCLQWEFGLVPLVTKTSLWNGVELTMSGSVIFARADNEDVNTVPDIVGKTVLATSISDSAGCQLPWGEMENYGLSLLQSPQQVIFAGQQSKVVQGVVDGVADVGLVGATFMYDLKHQGLVNVSHFKILGERREILKDGTPYPFPSSTELYPEWTVGAMPWVDDTVREEVYRALIDMSPDSEAAQAGRYATWHSAGSLGAVSSKQLRIGELVLLPGALLRCPRPNDLYSSIACPDQHVKLPRDVVETACYDQSMTCPEGAECICRPCMAHADRAISIIRLSDAELAAGGDRIPTGPEHLECRIMGVCAEVQQLQILRVVLTDYTYSTTSNFTFRWHSDPGANEVLDAQIQPALPLPGWPRWQYVMHVSAAKVGNHILEVFVDGVNVATSPFFIKIVPRECDDLQTANAKGSCVCASYTMDIRRQCIPYATLLPSVLAPLSVLAAALACVCLWRARRVQPSMLSIHPTEIHFADPPEVIGRGSFGLVVKATYRGTAVAVKRVIPPSKDLAPATTAFDSPFASLATKADSPRFLSSLPRHLPPPSPSPAPAALNDGADRMSVAPSAGSAEAPEEERDRMPASPVPMQDADALDDALSGPSNLASARGDDSLSPMSSLVTASLRKTGSVRSQPHTPFSSLPAFRRKSEVGTTIALASGRGYSECGSPPRSPLISRLRKSSSAIGLGQRHCSVDAAEGSVGSLESATTKITRSPEQTKKLMAELRSRFLEEMEVLARLRHPCITTVMGAVTEEGFEPMLVMELMEHGSLHGLVHNHTFPVEDEMVLPILRDIVHGMRFLHAADPPTIHGDLKPQNVLVDANMRAKISDFGLTQKRQLVEEEFGMAFGSPFWAPPERLRGEHPSKEGDVYAFGVLLCELATRKEPYEGMFPDEVVEAVAALPPPVPLMRPHCQGVDATLLAVIQHCWEQNPQDRPSFSELEVEVKKINCTSLGGVYDSRPNVNRMLEEIFPAHVAAALVEGRKVQPEHRECVSIFFSDIVGFTTISSGLHPMEVSEMLGRLYTKFDQLSTKHDVFKVETIGDAYMAVTNLAHDQPDHAARILKFASEAIEAASTTLIKTDDPSLGSVQIRVGIHSGPVVANVVGTRNPRYCLFGDTVNTASRMESLSTRGRINVSKATAELLRVQYPEGRLERRGLLQVKGKGGMECYLAEVREHVERHPGKLIDDGDKGSAEQDTPAAKSGQVSFDVKCTQALAMRSFKPRAPSPANLFKGVDFSVRRTGSAGPAQTRRRGSDQEATTPASNDGGTWKLSRLSSEPTPSHRPVATAPTLSRKARICAMFQVAPMATHLAISPDLKPQQGEAPLHLEELVPSGAEEDAQLTVSV